MRRVIRDLLRRGRKERKPGGIVDGHLAACPRSPNCVSTQHEKAEHRMRPIAVEESSEDVMGTVRQIMEAWPRTRIAEADGPYLHAECSSLGLGFVDDVEFLLDPQGEKLHFRSVSRIGYSDLGANRRRMQELSRRIEKALRRGSP